MNNVQIVLPENLENMQLPSPELITFYKNIEDRVLWFDVDVDACCLEYSRYILEWNKQDKGIKLDKRKPIKIMFYSYGGDLDVNNSLIDLIKLSKTPIHGYNMGTACSAGCYIFMACHKRYTLKNAYFLLHKGSGGVSGTYDQIKSEMENYTRQIEQLKKYILDNSKISQEVLDKNIITEWYVDSAKAIEYGICDGIITDIDELF